MILGVGSDIIDIRRIEKAIERFGERFLDRIFTEIERAKCDRRGASARASYASASPPRRRAPRRSAPGFAAACSGANRGGQPAVRASRGMRLTGGALQRLQAITPPGMVAQIDLTITDDLPQAQAIVIISANPA